MGRKLPPWKLAALPGGKVAMNAPPRPWEHAGQPLPFSPHELRMKCRRCRETHQASYIQQGLCGQCRAEDVVDAPHQ
jgi:hypothetical protein